MNIHVFRHCSITDINLSCEIEYSLTLYVGKSESMQEEEEDWIPHEAGQVIIHLWIKKIEYLTVERLQDKQIEINE